MRIEQSPVKPPQEYSSTWDGFFEHFAAPPSDQQKGAIIELFIQHLSHLIHQQTQRMINVYKHMRENH